MSDNTSRSSIPLRINSPESYESAVLEIEQEKQMVKALKRLSMGNMIDHDPDFPMEDPELFLMNEKEKNDDSTASLDTLSLSRSASPDSSNSHSPPFEGTEPSLSPYVTPEESLDSETLSVNHDHVLWVPANMHPEVNPQQFKHHVKVTIDDLLERKISRSKSSRSKRSSLSLSTNDDSNVDDDEADTSADSLLQNQGLTNRHSNPSLLKLSTELETLSRLAGMDSDDAVTLARSLSTHSLGYTDVEKAAIDELGSPNAHTGVNQAEILDFGVDKSPTKAFPGQQAPRTPIQQHSPSQQRFQGSPQASPLRRPQQRYTGAQHSPSEDPQFALKRSRRMNYRKPHASTPTHLGSQLQNKKAGNLAELRHNLNSSGMPMSYPTEPEGLIKSSPSRLSMQSINPRSSQVLFNYKGPLRLVRHPKLPASAPPNSAPPAPVPTPRRALGSNVGPATKDSPFGQAAIPDMRHNFGPRSLSAQNLMHQRHKQGLNSYPLRENLQKQYQGSNAAPQGYPPSPSPGQLRPQQRKASPTTRPRLDYGHGSAERRNYPLHQAHPQSQSQGAVHAEYKQHYPQAHPHSSPQDHKQRPIATRAGVPPRSRVTLSDSSKDQKPLSAQSPARTSRETKMEKTMQLNENLDMLRNEINEFKESLSHPEARKKEKPKGFDAERPQQDDTQTYPPEDLVPEISFDTSSTDVSYEDTLGMEREILVQSKDDVRTSTPISSPEKRGKRTSAQFLPTNREDFGRRIVADETKPQEPSAFGEAVKENRAVHNEELVEHDPEAGDELFDSNETDAVKERQETPVESIKESFTEKNANEQTPPREASRKEVDLKPLDYEIERRSSQASLEYSRSSEARPRSSSAQSEVTGVKQEEAPTMPVIDELKKLKKKKSFGSLTSSDKKKNKKTWLWSKGRSVSAQNISGMSVEQKPSRSVSSPDINSHKRDHKTSLDQKEPKESVISKLFKKKRSNSVESSEILQRRESSSEEKELKTIKRISSAIFGTSKDDDARSVSSKEEKEPSIEEVRLEILRENSADLTSKSSLISKMKAKVMQEEKEKEKTSLETVEVEQTIDEASEDDLDEQKPQTTLEVQEKIKKLIKRTSKANQPLEYTDSAFGFPLPPPSVSTLVMLDYRFPVHVERAIYRLSHLKLANRKRSLREQVLLSNFMYAYLNLVDHTLHLEQRMSEEDNAMEEPDVDLDLLNDDDKDTDFEGDDDALDDNAFDTVRLDLRGDPYNEITV